MARTRGKIKELVRMHTGRETTKEELENYLCDTALKMAVMMYSFKDSLSEPSDFAITEDAVSVSISTLTGLLHISTARIVEASGSRNTPLVMKDRGWWDKNVVNPEDNQKGWPEFGLRWGTDVIFNRPVDSGLELRLRVSREPSFTDDTTACPVACLDLFVEHYVTAYEFLSLKNIEAFNFWKSLALGPRFDVGEVGGMLLAAIKSDKFDSSEEIKVERSDVGLMDKGVAVENLITGHSDFGNVRKWY